MSTVAVGAYLWELRKDKAKLSRVAAAAKLETSKSQIERIEGGDGETRTSLLLAFTRLVGGSADHVTDLLLDEHATAEDGRNKAKEILSQGSYQRATQIAEQVPDYDIDIAVRFIDSLQENPEMLARLRQMLRGSDDEGDASQH